LERHTFLHRIERILRASVELISQDEKDKLNKIIKLSHDDPPWLAKFASLIIQFIEYEQKEFPHLSLPSPAKTSSYFSDDEDDEVNESISNIFTTPSTKKRKKNLEQTPIATPIAATPTESLSTPSTPTPSSPSLQASPAPTPEGKKKTNTQRIERFGSLDETGL